MRLPCPTFINGIHLAVRRITLWRYNFSPQLLLAEQRNHLTTTINRLVSKQKRTEWLEHSEKCSMNHNQEFFCRLYVNRCWNTNKTKLADNEVSYRTISLLYTIVKVLEALIPATFMSNIHLAEHQNDFREANRTTTAQSHVKSNRLNQLRSCQRFSTS